MNVPNSAGSAPPTMRTTAMTAWTSTASSTSASSSRCVGSSQRSRSAAIPHHAAAASEAIMMARDRPSYTRLSLSVHLGWARGGSVITPVDYHTAGEPFRIVTGGAPEIPGATVLDRREHARASEEVDRVRRLLCSEPRGHADMYGCFPVPPDDDGARLGVLFWHKDGYSTACGHGTIALGRWPVESGLIEAPPDGEAEVAID